MTQEDCFWLGEVECWDGGRYTGLVTETTVTLCVGKEIELVVKVDGILALGYECGWVAIRDVGRESFLRVKSTSNELTTTLYGTLKKSCKLSQYDPGGGVGTLPLASIPIPLRTYLSALYKKGDPEVIWVGQTNVKTQCGTYTQRMLIITLKGFYLVKPDRTVLRCLSHKDIVSVVYSTVNNEILLRAPLDYDLIIQPLPSSPPIPPLSDFLKEIYSPVHTVEIVTGRLTEPLGYTRRPVAPIIVEGDPIDGVVSHEEVPVLLRRVFKSFGEKVYWAGNVLCREGDVKRWLLYVTGKKVVLAEVGDPRKVVNTFERREVVVEAMGKWCAIGDLSVQPLEPPTLERVVTLVEAVEKGETEKNSSTGSGTTSDPTTIGTVTLLNASSMETSSAILPVEKKSPPGWCGRVAMDAVSGLPFLTPPALSHLTYFYPTLSNTEYPEVLWVDTVLKSNKKRLSLLTPQCLYMATHSSITRCIPISDIASTSQSETTFAIIIPSQYDLLFRVATPHSAKAFCTALAAVYKGVTSSCLEHYVVPAVEGKTLRLSKPVGWEPPSPTPIAMHKGLFKE